MKKTLKVLAIGNSFSDDGTRYLYDIGKKGPVEIKLVNLVIGGCSLHRHFINMMNDNRSYSMVLNGTYSGFNVSLKEALLCGTEWDVITLQQVSRLSVHYDKYQPYLNELVKYIRTLAPKAKLYLQETWAYEEGSKLLCEDMGYETSAAMLEDVRASYLQAAKDIHADGIIPSGEVMLELSKRGIEKVHRDTFHAHKGIGRYALALTWYMTLTGMDILDNPFNELDEPATEEEMKIARTAVHDIVSGFRPEQIS